MASPSRLLPTSGQVNLHNHREEETEEEGDNYASIQTRTNAGRRRRETVQETTQASYKEWTHKSKEAENIPLSAYLTCPSRASPRSGRSRKSVEESWVARSPRYQADSQEGGQANGAGRQGCPQRLDAIPE